MYVVKNFKTLILADKIMFMFLFSLISVVSYAGINIFIDILYEGYTIVDFVFTVVILVMLFISYSILFKTLKSDDI